MKCGHKHLDGGKFTQANYKTIEELRTLCNKGLSAKSIAKEMGRSEKTISKYITKYEKLTEEQKQLIIKFGVHCNVPMPYLAPYIPCSSTTCKKVMNEYKKRMGIKWI